MIRYFFVSKAWKPLEQVLAAWNYLRPELPGLMVEDPIKAGYYEVIRRASCPPMLQASPNFTWEKIKFDGYLSNLHPFDGLDKIIGYGPEFRNVRPFVSYYVSIDYQEKGIEQISQYCNSVEIWFQDCESRVMFSFSGFNDKSQYLEMAKLAELVRKIEEKTCFKIGDTRVERPELGIRRPLDSGLPPQALAEGLKTIMDLVSYDKIFSAHWTLACPSPDNAQIQAIKCYNRVAELKIPAERYELEVVSRFNTWEAVDDIRPLCGPTDRLIHPLGWLKLPKRNKLVIYFMTSAEGHQLVVETTKSLKEVDLSKNLISRLESLGIDFSRSYTDKELLNKPKDKP